MLYNTSTGSTGIERKLVLNRDNYPIFETTNCLQGTYHWYVIQLTRLRRLALSLGNPDRCFYDKMWNLQRVPRLLTRGKSLYLGIRYGSLMTCARAARLCMRARELIIADFPLVEFPPWYQYNPYPGYYVECDRQRGVTRRGDLSDADCCNFVNI